MLRGGTMDDSIAVPASTRRKRQSALKQKRFIVGGLIVLLAIGYLVFSTMQDTMMYYVTVGELLGKGDGAGQQVRLAGTVQEGSLQSDAKAMTHRFVVTDAAQQIPVVYKGVAPDAFKGGVDVVVEGRLARNGTFEATNLLAKCPSKYEPGS